MPDDYVLLDAFPDGNVAAMVRARLEAEGIPVRVPNEYTAALNIPFVDNRVRIYVPADREREAHAVLSGEAVAHWRGDALDDDDDEHDDDDETEWEGERASDQCPACGAHGEAQTPGFIETFFDIVLGSAAHRYRCPNCNETWRE